MEKEFEDYWKKAWKEQQRHLLEKAPASLREERKNYSGFNTAADWILFIVPIVVMIIFGDRNFISNWLLNFVATVAVGVVCFAIANVIKPYVTGKRSIADIDEDIKTYYYNVYKQHGLEYIDSL